jgi:peptide chain release factor 1
MTMTEKTNNEATPNDLEPFIRSRLDEMSRRYEEIEKLMGTPEVAANPSRPRALAKEFGILAKTIGPYRRLLKLRADEESARRLLDGEPDPEMQQLVREELDRIVGDASALVSEVRSRFVLEDEDASRNVIMEIRAGTGGEEAALFAADLFGMYRRYAEGKGWKVELMTASPTDLGGFKEIIFGVSGEEVYGRLRYESGGHRVQRVPETETQGRIHTSASTVAVLPEVEEVEFIVKDEDLEIDRYHSSGPGGQHVNKTASAIRIHHKPTGLIVQCQDEKSQYKNLARAMRILRSRLHDMEEEKRRRERALVRRTMIGSGDRSQRIRTYNFPQNRVTDHRIHLTLHNLDRVIMGELDELVRSLIEHDRRLRIEELAKEDEKTRTQRRETGGS